MSSSSEISTVSSLEISSSDALSDGNSETNALPKPSEDSPTSQPLPSVPLAAGRSNEQRAELLARWWPTSTSRGPPRDDAMLSLVLDSPQTLELVNPMKYSESLMRFVKDLGPTAQRVAMRKIREAEAAASMYPMEAASGSCSHPWAPFNQVDGVQMPPREFSAGSSSVPRADLAVLPQGITAGSSSVPTADLAVPSQEIHPPPASEPFTDAAIGQRVLGSRRQTAGTEHPNQRRRMFSWVQPTGVAPDPDADDPSLKGFKFDWFTAQDNLANLPPPPPVVPAENPPPPAVEPEAESSAAKDTAEDVGSSKSRKP